MQSLKYKGVDVALGYDDLSGYLENDGYLGAVVGRCGNRIAKGVFGLNGKEYHLFVNNGPNHLHGGKIGFSHKIWTAEELSDGVRFSLVSPDGDENYPGMLKVSVCYRLKTAALTSNIRRFPTRTPSATSQTTPISTSTARARATF